jgi:hypothetical protein
MSKQEGLVKKFEVTKLSNPEKKLDCIVLEFDDPIARRGIQAWAEAMLEAGITAAQRRYWVSCYALKVVI